MNLKSLQIRMLNRQEELTEAIEWETDPPEMKREPFYRLMGFVIDKKYRGKGIGSKALEMTFII